MAKVSDKLKKVNDSFNVYMYDNGFMLEISGRDKDEDYVTSKLIVSTVEELVHLVKEVCYMTRD